MKPLPVIVAVSGASGAVYGIRLIKALVETGRPLIVILSDAGVKVLAHEMGYDARMPFAGFLKNYGVVFKKETVLDVFSQGEIEAASASGSFIHSGMVVAPCSMKTLAAISCGYADNLITRSADVCIKESRPLILVPRETPYSLIHLENMVRVKKAGAVVLPPSPSFYRFPRTVEDLVDTVTARILDHLGIVHNLLPRWGD